MVHNIVDGAGRGRRDWTFIMDESFKDDQANVIGSTLSKPVVALYCRGLDCQAHDICNTGSVSFQSDISDEE